MDGWDTVALHALKLNGATAGREWLLNWAARSQTRRWKGVSPKKPLAVFQVRSSGNANSSYWQLNQKRGVQNMAAVAEAFARSYPEYAVRIVEPGVLPLADQIAVHRNAELLVLPHGAGMAHMAWLKLGARVVEIVPKSKAQTRMAPALAYGFGLCFERILVPSDIANISLRVVTDALTNAAPIIGNPTWLQDAPCDSSSNSESAEVAAGAHSAARISRTWLDNDSCVGNTATAKKQVPDLVANRGFKFTRAGGSVETKARCVGFTLAATAGGAA